MAVVINLSDPGAVPGASTQDQPGDQLEAWLWVGAKQDRRGRKGRAFARHGSAVIGPNP